MQPHPRYNRNEISQTSRGYPGEEDWIAKDGQQVYAQKTFSRAWTIQDGGGQIVLDEEDEGRTELNGERRTGKRENEGERDR